jgi:hypothetical protein
VPSSRKFLLYLARQVLADVENLQFIGNKKRIDTDLKSLQSELEIMLRLSRDMAARTDAEVVKALIDRHRAHNVCNAK